MTAVVPMAATVGLVLLAGVLGRAAGGARPLGAAARASAVVRQLIGLGTRRRASGDEVEEVVRLRTALASGGSTFTAFSSLAAAEGPWADAAGAVVRRTAAGLPVHAAIDLWAVDGEGPALVADALAIAGTSGGSPVGALDAVVATLHDRRSLQREIRALASQAVASAAVLVLAPVAFALLIAAVDHRVRSFFLGSFAGLACVVGGALLDAVGAIWMRALVRRVR